LNWQSPSRFGPANDPLRTFRVCACHKLFRAAEDSLHALSCELNNGPRNTHHDAIRDMLYQLIKKLHPGIQRTHLTMECVAGQILNEGENPRNVRTGIKFVKGADTLCIDIAVVDPAAAPYMQTPTSHHIHRDGAASKHYSRVNVPSPLTPRSVIPFILEATGRLGLLLQCAHPSHYSQYLNTYPLPNSENYGSRGEDRTTTGASATPIVRQSYYFIYIFVLSGSLTICRV
jgi:hypothetical protein